MADFEKIDSRVAFEGKLATVRLERFRYDDGEEAEREIVKHPGAVAILARDGDGLILVRQPREAVGDPALLELPAGKLDQGEDPLATAKRELAEEVGKGARSWTPVKSFYTSPGFTDEECHVYLATGLSDASGGTDEHERIDVEVRRLAELDAIIDEVRDSKTLIGLLELRRRASRD